MARRSLAFRLHNVAAIVAKARGGRPPRPTERTLAGMSSSTDPTGRSYGHRYLSGADVRRAFIEFFEARGAKELPSSSLVPHNDPTVLLTTAGMQQMTPFFLGLEAPPAPRLCSVQKCFRTVD